MVGYQDAPQFICFVRHSKICVCESVRDGGGGGGAAERERETERERERERESDGKLEN